MDQKSGKQVVQSNKPEQKKERNNFKKWNVKEISATTSSKITLT